MSDVVNLGKLLEGNPGRDAVHIALAPVVANDRLRPGQRVCLIRPNLAVAPTPGNAQEEAAVVGIIDPFLVNMVEPGQLCYLCLFPNTVTSLRHVWSHPAFPNQEMVTQQAIDESSRWMRQWVSEQWGGYDDYSGNAHNITAESILEAADNWIDSGEYLHGGSELEGVPLPDDFWLHYSVIRQRIVPPAKRRGFFRCSC